MAQQNNDELPEDEDIFQLILDRKLTRRDLSNFGDTEAELRFLLLSTKQLMDKLKRQNNIVARLNQLFESERRLIKIMSKQRDEDNTECAKLTENNRKLKFLIEELKKKDQKLSADPHSNYLIEREKAFQRRMEFRRIEADPSIAKLKEEYSRLKKVNEDLENKLSAKNEEMVFAKLELAQFKHVRPEDEQSRTDNNEFEYALEAEARASTTVNDLAPAKHLNDRCNEADSDGSTSPLTLRRTADFKTEALSPEPNASATATSVTNLIINVEEIKSEQDQSEVIEGHVSPVEPSIDSRVRMGDSHNSSTYFVALDNDSFTLSDDESLIEMYTDSVNGSQNDLNVENNKLAPSGTVAESSAVCNLSDDDDDDDDYLKIILEIDTTPS